MYDCNAAKSAALDAPIAAVAAVAAVATAGAGVAAPRAGTAAGSVGAATAGALAAGASFSSFFSEKIRALSYVHRINCCLARGALKTTDACSQAHRIRHAVRPLAAA